MRKCPLCLSTDTQLFHHDKKRFLFHCQQCELVFADASSHLPPHAEQHRYLAAKNKQHALGQFILALVAQCELHHSTLVGLNFGRTLNLYDTQKILDRGHQLHQYDPTISPWSQDLVKAYDFVSCFRVFEHFRFPAKEWALLSRLVKPGGWLAINTPILHNLDNFPKWHHKNNLTHVSFYQQATFEFLVKNSHFKLLFAANDLILVQKTS